MSKKAPLKPAAAEAPTNPYAQMAVGAPDTFAAPVLSTADVDDATAPLRDKVNARSTQLLFGITDIPNDPCGRRTIARKAIAPGTAVLREKSLLWAPFWEQRNLICRNCTTPLAAKATENGADAMWAFCSPKCKSALAWLVELEAPLTGQLEMISESTNVDACLLRTSIQLILTQAQVKLAPDSAVAKQARGERFAVGSNGAVESTMADIEGLASHERMLAAENSAVVAQAAKMVWPLLPARAKEALGLTLASFTAAVLAMSSRINANAHALQPLEDPTPFGLGLYPTAAFFNHSCYPNCVFVNNGNTLVVRAIRPIAAGEELCVNYTSLDADRLARRTSLLREKTFYCHCRRCELAPADEDERRRFAADAALCGVRVAPLTEREAAALSLVDAVEALLPPGPVTSLLGNGRTAPVSASGPVINLASIPGGIYIEDALPFRARAATAAAAETGAGADATAATAAVPEADGAAKGGKGGKGGKGKGKGGKGKGKGDDSDFDLSDEEPEKPAAKPAAAKPVTPAAAVAAESGAATPSVGAAFAFKTYDNEPTPGDVEADAWRDAYVTEGTATGSADAAARVSLHALLAEKLAPAQAAVQAAIETYTSSGAATLAGMRQALDRALLVCTQHLAPGHELFFTVLPLLINVATKQRDYAAKLEFARAYAAMAERVFPAAFPPLGNVFIGVEQASARVEEAATGPTRKAVAARARALRRVAVAKQIEVIGTSYGKEDPRLSALRERLAKL